MGKNAKRPKTSKVIRQRYDVSMILDFLDQLHLEMLVEQFEDADPDTVGDELYAQVRPLVKKYDCRLTHVDYVDPRGVPPAQHRAAKMRLHAALAAKRQLRIDAMEALAECFDEALQCASRPLTQEPELTHKLIDYLCP